jgi:hypothetical protein
VYTKVQVVYSGKQQFRSTLFAFESRFPTLVFLLMKCYDFLLMRIQQKAATVFAAMLPDEPQEGKFSTDTS